MRCYIVEKLALQNNLRVLRAHAGKTVIWGVLKGNGYGLGCIEMAHLLSEAGIDHFAVTDIAELRALRQAGFSHTPVLMLENTCNPRQLSELLSCDCIPTVGSREDAAQLSLLGMKQGTPIPVHVKIDTGMGRFGFLPEQLPDVLQLFSFYPGIAVAGVYTHFSNASNPSVTHRQFERFQTVVCSIRRRGFDPGMVHCCNSTAFWNYPCMRLDAVRLGSCLLGRVPWADCAGLTQLGYCQAAVEEVRWIPAGHTVGYGCGWRSRRATRIAVLDIGYFHGFGVQRGYDLWRFSDCLRGAARYIKALFRKKVLYVRLNGHTCRVLGHVGMVNTVIDVTHCPCQPGDTATADINPLLLKGLEVIYQ